MSSLKLSICNPLAETGNLRLGGECKMSTNRASTNANSGTGSGSKRKKVVKSRFKGSPLDDFFCKYTHKGFDYKPSSSAPREFERLCSFMKWDDKDNPKRREKRREARKLFQDALTQQFNVMYGEDENELAAWQSLCAALELDPIPDTVEKCRESIRLTFVNLVDLVDIQRTGKSVQRFNSEVALSTYTKAEEKYFPRENAYQSGLLRYLLRHITSPDVKYHTGGHKSRKKTSLRKV
ncbi:hypothetical protein CONPUDRAFT_105427 [Coniophora puteana RWD-64-598 SS2]|uniref:Uncharacterized protein n=1 Tax=Coniophora puteana (strain RWD-64-598) TaxID=741705 RepID=A0A5M3MNW5_CONPW|nr:uncharacterized protein CONPUDRAFT_105427 [Coniophora puteana RWD-64-598 SS2]EIW80425.1 hypothetical protein CONPUDRAFT_105427 [Coniophora puteana RWD-64-598 SS2]